MPLRWQDITAESLIACALVALLLLSAYLWVANSASSLNS